MTKRDIIDRLDARQLADKMEVCPECLETMEAHNLVHHLTNSHAWRDDDIVTFFNARVHGVWRA